jgi:hypothetical protein
VTLCGERKHPEWLDPRQQVFSPKYGQGKVISWVGNTLIVKFPGYSIPVQYKNWQQAVEKSEIAPGDVPTTPESSSEAEENGASEVQPASFSQVRAAEIAAIPQPKFRAIALELASNLSAVALPLQHLVRCTPFQETYLGLTKCSSGIGNSPTVFASN